MVFPKGIFMGETRSFVQVSVGVQINMGCILPQHSSDRGAKFERS